MRRSLSDRLSDNLFLLGVGTRLPELKSLSTGALEGLAVLNFMDNLNGGKTVQDRHL